ncbi:MAG TPA: hypothetical protein VFB34_14305 [Chloroflexota bacterium]|nr:hypothetical protein [Chloroflexota bacterium]
MTYTWDQAGNLVNQTYPDGNSARFSCNQLDQMSSASDWPGHTTSFTYDSAGNLSEIEVPQRHHRRLGL